MMKRLGSKTDWLEAGSVRPAGLMRQFLKAVQVACPDLMIRAERKFGVLRAVTVSQGFNGAGFRATTSSGTEQFTIDLPGPGLTVRRRRASAGEWQQHFLKSLPAAAAERFLEALAELRGHSDLA